MDNEHKSRDAAEGETSRRDTILLSARASLALIESFFSPREPNAALKRAQKRHTALIVSDNE